MKKNKESSQIKKINKNIMYRISGGFQSNSGRDSDVLVEGGSFIRLKDIT